VEGFKGLSNKEADRTSFHSPISKLKKCSWVK